MYSTIRWLPATVSPRHSLQHLHTRPQSRNLSIHSRTYDDALQLLNSLQPNAAATSLFNARNPTSASPSASSRSSLNARAIPEVKEWLSRAGYSTSDLKRLRCVHVAGTKGKGSTCAYTAAVLRKALDDPLIAGRGEGRRRVGMYTSPHLVSVRERIEIDGEIIPRDVFARRFFEIWDAFGREAEIDGGLDGVARPFYFRFLTILAFHVFLSERVRDVVVECGIGGEYDATNILPAEAVSAGVVTHLGIDHVAMLGDTVEEIAWHKAGIFKEGVTAFTRTQSPSVMKVLRERAAEKGTRLVELTDDDMREGPWNQRQGLGLEGEYQRDNRALAVMAALQHLKGIDSPDAARKEAWIPDALRHARLKGRGQTLAKGRAIWHLDGAHTEDSVRLAGGWFASKTKDRKTKRILVFNQQDRDANALLKALVAASGPRGFDLAIFTRNEVRSIEGADLSVQRGLEATMKRAAPGTKATAFGSLEETLRMVEGYNAGVEEVDVLVTGSLYLVGGVLQALGEGAP
ncbi:hypothetical protein jhhlp_005271 [Lomentospora prolificans]|uniref:Folylpolyglutamate synthase n=1 Tax=Lomentospora prolificans TaxID=41688 RepID=A0A2N3N7E8_9PEZI|nr:hypothetical protein jhhlp_005271 [Lomentospora prolificans]